MKLKMYLGALAALFISFSAIAGPARPGAYQYTQPDGSVVSLENHGDEFFHWTTLAGTSQTMRLEDDGFWHPSTLDFSRLEKGRERRTIVNKERVVRPRTHTNNPWTHGERRIPVILVEFPDKGFAIDAPGQMFYNLLNQPGYSYDGATGSVQEYFLDNSDGLFKPVFDVYGPVMLPHEMAYYGKDVDDWDQQPELALYDACVILDPEVDFSVYDFDGNGFIDMTLFYFAGYSQAEGGPKDAIWPHQWTVQGSSSYDARSTRFDGKKLDSYFCTAELKGSRGTSICGIGATCHEFSHSLGLPDFYDTDYEKNGSCAGLSDFSLMCGGCYLNESRTPPYLNAEERILLGWMTEEDVPELTEGSFSFPSVKESIAYKSLTDTEGEYFVFECRDGSGWDSYLPQGLVVYHADKSTGRNVGGKTPEQRWKSQDGINAYGNHPCFYVVPAASQNSLNFKGSLGRWVFPGDSKVKDYSPKDWDGNTTGTELKEIGYSEGKVSFKVTVDRTRTVRGYVYNTAGKGIAGAHVVITPKDSPDNAPRGILSRIIRKNQVYNAYTDEKGAFAIDVTDFEAPICHITASMEKYVTEGTDITLKKRGANVNLTLRLIGQNDYQYYDSSATQYAFGDGESTSLMSAIRIPASELPEGGGKVLSVSFEPLWKASAYYVIIDSGDKRLVTHKTPTIQQSQLLNMVTVDLNDVNSNFPPGKDLYVGYAVKNAVITDNHYKGCLFVYAAGSTNLYMSPFDLTRSSWFTEDDAEGFALVLNTSIVATPKEEVPASFADLGMPGIADPGNGHYAAGDAFPLEVLLPEGVSPASVAWYYDSKDVTGSKSVSLSSGQHVLNVTLKYADGSEETLELRLDVK